MALKINVSEFSDFCFGVKRAISLARNALKKSRKPVFSLGPLIHNRQVVDELSQKGLSVIRDYKRIEKGTVVTRSHGIHPYILDKIKRRNIEVVDATCPFVRNAQLLAERLSKEGYNLIIIGDKGHPEVKSLKCYSGNKAAIIANRGDAKKFRFKKGRIGVIAQTTQSLKNFMEVIEELLNKEYKEIRIFNTICSDVNRRQKSAERLSGENDLIIVVGGKDSANTKRLYEICRALGKRTHHIETVSEIKGEWLKDKKRIGVVSGASTPRWIVDEVVGRLSCTK